MCHWLISGLICAQPLTREQYVAHERLHGLLDRRAAVDAGSLISPEDQAWLVRALNLVDDAHEFLHGCPPDNAGQQPVNQPSNQPKAHADARG